MNNKAFTLIELLIIVVIAGILIGVSAPRFRPAFDSFELKNSLKDIFNLSRYLQGASISQGKIYCLNIDKANAEFWVSVKEDSAFKEISGRLGKRYRVPSGIIISTEPEEKNGVYFYPDGNVNKITITFENQHKDKACIVIKGGLGNIEIQ